VGERCQNLPYTEEHRWLGQTNNLSNGWIDWKGSVAFLWPQCRKAKDDFIVVIRRQCDDFRGLYGEASKLHADDIPGQFRSWSKNNKRFPNTSKDHPNTSEDHDLKDFKRVFNIIGRFANAFETSEDIWKTGGGACPSNQFMKSQRRRGFFFSNRKSHRFFLSYNWELVTYQRPRPALRRRNLKTATHSENAWIVFYLHYAGEVFDNATISVGIFTVTDLGEGDGGHGPPLRWVKKNRRRKKSR